MTRRDFVFFSSILASPLAAFTLEELKAIQKGTKSETTLADDYEQKRIPKIIVKDKLAQSSIYEIARPIFQTSTRKDKKCVWRIYVVDTGRLNAYTCGYGLICIEKELIKVCKNETMLASVIAHEVGHVHHKHAERRISTDRLYKYFKINKFDKQSSEKLYKSYHRLWEKEADAFIIKAFLKTGYNLNQAHTFMEILAKKYPNNKPIGQCLFNTHPDALDRVNKIKSIASTFSQSEYRQDDSKEFKYLKQISG